MLVSPLIDINDGSYQEANKRQSQVSPSGKYVLNVPIERSKTERGILGFGEPYRHVTISDPNGNILYRDSGKDFPARFGTYWIWDEKDRVWIYGSDWGICYYEFKNGIWTRYGWEKGNKEKDITPPESLYPSNYKRDTSEEYDL